MAEGNANERVPDKKIREYSNPSADGFGSSIVRPPIEANSFELKPSMIQMIQHRTQFAGLPNESNQHMTCRLSKYHSKKPESTGRTIFNRDSTLQLIVQISSENIN